MTKPIEGIAEQGSEAWHRARAGKCTASRFREVARNRAGSDWSETARSYCFEIVGERLLLDNPDWVPSPQLKTAAIAHGNDMEPFARAAYQWRTGANIVCYGFVPWSDCGSVGGSPDGVHVDGSGILEIKCPYTTREHVRTLATGAVPKQYVAQVQGLLMVTGRDWCDFVSFDNRLADGQTMAVVRVGRDEGYIGRLSSLLQSFAEYVDETERKVRHDAKRKQHGVVA